MERVYVRVITSVREGKLFIRDVTKKYNVVDKKKDRNRVRSNVGRGLTSLFTHTGIHACCRTNSQCQSSRYTHPININICDK
jgi:hypothetical protein